MRVSTKQFQVLRYVLGVLLLVLGIIGLKALIIWMANLFLYGIPIVGGWLQSLEIVELVNIPLFAVLGFGIGVATLYLPPRRPLWQKSIALMIALPLVFLSGYWVQQTLWLRSVAANSEVTYQDAVEVANTVLVEEIGSDGFWGYFRITTQLPILPTTTQELSNITNDQRWFRSELTRFSGIEPGIFTLLFNSTGWGIRLVHLLIALLTGLIYFVKGLAWSDAVRLRHAATGKP